MTWIQKAKGKERLERIETLGGFGQRRTQVVSSKKDYNRLDKSWRKYD